MFQWVGTTCRGPTGGRVLEGVFKLPLSPPQARKFGHYLLQITAVYTVRMPDHNQTIVPTQTTLFAIRLTKCRRLLYIQYRTPHSALTRQTVSLLLMCVIYVRQHGHRCCIGCLGHQHRLPRSHDNDHRRLHPRRRLHRRLHCATKSSVALGCNQHACCIHPMVYIWYHYGMVPSYTICTIYICIGKICIHRENINGTLYDAVERAARAAAARTMRARTAGRHRARGDPI